jgi:hypothetical protein
MEGTQNALLTLDVAKWPFLWPAKHQIRNRGFIAVLQAPKRHAFECFIANPPDAAWQRRQCERYNLESTSVLVDISLV